MSSTIQEAVPSSDRTPLRLLLAALLLLLICLPPESHGLSKAACAALIALLALLGWGSAPRIAREPFVIGALLAMPLIWCAQAPGAAISATALLLLAAAAGIAARGACVAERTGREICYLLALGGAGVALHGLVQKIWGLEKLAAELAINPAVPDHADVMTILASGRAFSVFSTPAALGGFLVLVLPVTASLALESSGYRRGLLWAAVALELAGLGASASVTAGAALLGALALGALVWSRIRGRLIAALTVTGLIVLVIFISRGEGVRSFADPAGSLRLRAGNFRAAVAMSGDHPWIGVGPGGFAERYPAYMQPGDNETRHVHDLPLELVAETGLFAGSLLTFLFFCLFLGPLLRLGRESSIWKLGLAVGLASFALQNLVDFTAFLPSIIWLAALLRGTISVSGRPRPSDAGPDARILGGAGLAIVCASAFLAGASGISRDYRIEGRAAAFAGELERAERLAQRAANIAPWEIEAALLATRTTADAGGQGAALELADKAVALSPVRASARMLRARKRLAAGDFPGAYADAAEAVLLHPQHEEYARDLATLRARISEFSPPGGGSDE